MKCKICENTLGPKAKLICRECNSHKHVIKCIECYKEYNVTAHYYIKLDISNNICKQCKLKGEGNPNFGNRWSDELKNKVSVIVKSRVDDTFKSNCAKGMRGKTVSSDTLLKRKSTYQIKVLNGWKRPKMSEETKKKIGKKSAEKFTNDFLLKQRKINEKLGHWIPLEKKDDYLLYKKLSNWNSNVICENTVGVALLKQYNMKSKTNNNANSLVRDHMYGRKAGFDNGVFPELLRHPANCQLITHSNNIKKAKFNNDCAITLDELMYKILNWNTKYDEQSTCLLLIEQYKKGVRYNTENYINNYYE